MITTSPTTPADLEATGGPFSYRVQALTARVDDRIVGVAGLGFQRSGATIVWARFTDELRKRPVWLHKQALKFLADAKRNAKVLVAHADPDQPAAERWLTRLGFEPHVVGKDKVFIWREEAKRNVGV